MKGMGRAGGGSWLGEELGAAACIDEICRAAPPGCPPLPACLGVCLPACLPACLLTCNPPHIAHDLAAGSLRAAACSSSSLGPRPSLWCQTRWSCATCSRWGAGKGAGGRAFCRVGWVAACMHAPARSPARSPLPHSHYTSRPSYIHCLPPPPVCPLVCRRTPSTTTRACLPRSWSPSWARA